MNAKVRYRAESVASEVFAVRKLVMAVDLRESVLTIDPLSFLLPRGSLAGSVRIDGRRAVPATSVDMRLTGARLESLIRQGAGPKSLEGSL
jgi:hypothetical protein